MDTIAIIDYGMGNIHSVQKALESLGASVIISNDPKEIKQAKKIVLPGVGAFDDAMKVLKKQGLIPALNKHIHSKKAFLGICLGMQLLFASSQEAKKSQGLGILKGEVVRFKDNPDIKVPHIGWNQINFKDSKCPLLQGLASDAYVYFCHSYYPKPDKVNLVAASCRYGVNFAAVLWQENIYGTQFHPEKSQKIGLRILENFIKLC